MTGAAGAVVAGAPACAGAAAGRGVAVRACAVTACDCGGAGRRGTAGDGLDAVRDARWGAGWAGGLGWSVCRARRGSEMGSVRNAGWRVGSGAGSGSGFAWVTGCESCVGSDAGCGAGVPCAAGSCSGSDSGAGAGDTSAWGPMSRATMVTGTMISGGVLASDSRCTAHSTAPCISTTPRAIAALRTPCGRTLRRGSRTCTGISNQTPGRAAHQQRHGPSSVSATTGSVRMARPLFSLHHGFRINTTAAGPRRPSVAYPDSGWRRWPWPDTTHWWRRRTAGRAGCGPLRRVPSARA